ncbi:MAG: hypothetical protein IJV65_01835 [Kiritimatiellae bacterium]|nr:hypothetical protein [Kiritimatiellia bacterium]
MTGFAFAKAAAVAAAAAAAAALAWRFRAPLLRCIRRVASRAVWPFVTLLDALDAVCGWLKRLLVRAAFPRGESILKTAFRPLRRAAALRAARWGELFFRPDETVAADPLRPSARVVAGGVAQAFARGVPARPAGFRLLVCRVPGRTVAIRLDAARRRCFVDVAPPHPDAPAHAEAALPAFAPGAAPTRFLVAEDNLRLVLRATPAGVAIARPR